MPSACPSRLRRLASLAIDAVVLLIVAPVALVPAVAVSWLSTLGSQGDCPSPCDGPGMLAASVWLMVTTVIWLAYWPLSVFWRRATVGSRVLGLRFDGRGLHRHLVWKTPP